MGYRVGMAYGVGEPPAHYGAAHPGIPDQALNRRHSRHLQQALAAVSGTCVV
jgi:hypothetical protein